jgi:hypothetical protein
MEHILHSLAGHQYEDIEVDILQYDDTNLPESINPEHVTIIYPVLSKDFHYVDIDNVRIKHNPDIFKIENSKEFVYKDVKLALLMKSAIYLLFSSDGDSESLIKKVFDELLPAASASAKEHNRTKIQKAITSAIESRVHEFKSNIELNESSAEDKQKELLQLYRKILTDKKALEALDGTKGQWINKAQEEYTNIHKLVPNLYDRITLEEEYLCAYVHDLSINYDGTEYYLGDFQVKIKLDTGGLEILNQSKKIDGYDHPHINDGVPCLGNVGPGIIRMLAEFELFGALQMIHKYLHSYNPDSVYKKIEFWDPDYIDEEENRYDGCRDNNSGFNCVECGDGDCPYYEESFEVCSDNASYDECRECDYLCRFGRRIINEHGGTNE